MLFWHAIMTLKQHTCTCWYDSMSEKRIYEALKIHNIYKRILHQMYQDFFFAMTHKILFHVNCTFARLHPIAAKNSAKIFNHVTHP